MWNIIRLEAMEKKYETFDEFAVVLKKIWNEYPQEKIDSLFDSYERWLLECI